MTKIFFTILISAICFAISASASNDEFQVRESLIGMSKCFRIDTKGDAVGTPVDDTFCHADFTVGQFSRGTVAECFNVDRNGKTYGGPVDDELCHASYKEAVDPFLLLKETLHCFHADRSRTVYGKPVDESNCGNQATSDEGK
jgi:hypothetical protein